MTFLIMKVQQKNWKKVGKDNQAGKATLVSILGEENAKKNV